MCLCLFLEMLIYPDRYSGAMKRKLIRHGNSSLSVTLPAKWASRFGLKKGDTIEVEELNNQLLLSTRKQRRLKSIEIGLSGLDRSLIRHHIVGAYILGYDQIVLKYVQESAAVLSKRGKEGRMLVSVIIEETVNGLIGMEIMEHTAEKAVIKDLSDAMADEFDTVLKRIFTMLLSYGDGMVEAIEGKDRVMLAELQARNKHIERFIIFCLRYIHKKSFADSRTATLNYASVECLYGINMVYAYICEEQSLRSGSIQPSTVRIVSNINELFQAVSELFFAYSRNKVREIVEQRAALFKRINIETDERGKEDTLLLARAVVIINEAHSLTKKRIMLQELAQHQRMHEAARL